MDYSKRIINVCGNPLILEKGDCFSFEDPFSTIKTSDHILIHEVSDYYATGHYMVIASRGDGKVHKYAINVFEKQISTLVSYCTKYNYKFEFIPISSVKDKILAVKHYKKLIGTKKALENQHG